MQIGLYDDDSKRCSFQGCSQVHFLASRCGFCGAMFCCDHTSVTAHACPVFNAQSPGYSSCLAAPPEFEKRPSNNVFLHHIDDHFRAVPSSKPEENKGRVYCCSYGGCLNNCHVPIVCESCGNLYCIEHRAPTRHECRMASKSAGKLTKCARSPAPSLALCSAVFPTLSSSSSLKIVPRNTPSTALGAQTENAVIPLIFFSEDLNVSPFFMRFSPMMVLGRLLDLAVGQAALDSASAAAGGPWVLQVINRTCGTSGLSVIEPSLSLTLKEVGVGNDTVVYIGTKRTAPETLVRGFSNKIGSFYQNGRSKRFCSIM